VPGNQPQGGHQTPSFLAHLLQNVYNVNLAILLPNASHSRVILFLTFDYKYHCHIIKCNETKIATNKLQIKFSSFNVFS